MGWESDAACAGRVASKLDWVSGGKDLYRPPTGTHDRWEQQRAVCASCRVFAECEAEELSDPVGNRLLFMHGTSPRERQQAREGNR